jgi:predicted hotdog family 3-hydroxylacyl-ACP dehydratase
MLLLDEVLEDRAGGVAAAVTVDPGAWYAEPGGAMPSWFGLELMAQTIATYGGLQKKAQDQSPKLGYLLGSRDYRVTVPAFPAGAHLRIEAQLCYFDESGISAFDCRILLGDAEVATATLKTYEKP